MKAFGKMAKTNKKNPWNKADALIFKKNQKLDNEPQKNDCVPVIMAVTLAEFPDFQIFCSM